MSLRVMTYNIRNGRGWDQRVDLGRVAGVIAAFDRHVVALQEVDLDHVRSAMSIRPTSSRPVSV